MKHKGFYAVWQLTVEKSRFHSQCQNRLVVGQSVPESELASSERYRFPHGYAKVPSAWRHGLRILLRRNPALALSIVRTALKR